MRLIIHRLTRNILGWKEGTHTLTLEFRGTKEELMELLKEELEKDLKRRNA